MVEPFSSVEAKRVLVVLSDGTMRERKLMAGGALRIMASRLTSDLQE